MSFAKRKSKLVKQLTEHRVSSEVTSEAIRTYLEALDCPRSLTVSMLYFSGEHEQLANLGFDPLNYNDSVQLRDAYAATAFLSKYKGLTLSYDLDEQAFVKFDKFELNCKQTNARFRNLATDPLFEGPVVWLHNAIIRKIALIVGSITYQDFVGLANWGPGASTLIKSVNASAAHKFQCETGITRGLFDLFPPELFKGSYPAWFEHCKKWEMKPHFEQGNKVVTVPKDAKANRVIAIEPGINIWFQLAIGNYLAKRLLRFGIDIRDQTRNQKLARLGSLDQKLATIDFSSASDSIAKSVVTELFPSRFVTLMEACRSHVGVQGDRKVVWEKFSSMGNGFTFPIETVIFYATALCCAEYLQVPLSKGESTVSAYGDDVIIPVSCLELFSRMCQFYGFTLNMKKSHFSSCFRESCGKHYYLGADVTPIYLKDRLLSVLAVYRFANAVRRLAHRRNSYLGCDSRMRPVFDYLVNCLPKALQLRIDDSLGDGGFISNWDEATPRGAKRGFEGSYVEHFTAVGKTYVTESVGLLLDRLWQLARRDEKNRPSRSHNWLSSIGPALFESSQAWSPELAHLLNRDRGNSVSKRGAYSVRLSNSLVARWKDLGPWW